ncbi:MAG: RDD family protein [Bdellovibrionales bacterium]|nr:RDD family protein [Bdellovibrionales bacterium]
MDSQDPTSLKFKPMTRGLGFHPFSDGLPYAPVSQAPKPKDLQPPPGKAPSLPPAALGTQISRPSAPRLPLPPARAIPAQRITPPSAMGTGAVSAGLPRFAPQPRVSVSVAPGVPVERPGILYLAKRSLAYLLDTAVNVGSVGGSFAFAASQMGLGPRALFEQPDTALLVSLFLFAFNWALVAGQEIAFGTSLGKRAFGLELDGRRAAATFLRAFFFVFSLGCFGLGLLWAIVDRERRCWHDWLADLAPREIARL